MINTDAILKHLDSNKLYVEDVRISEIPCIVEVEISWGDWKHEHLRCDYLMEDLGYRELSTEVTEEDGSDCYSAIHRYIEKDILHSAIML